jgi:hypothetical protein
LKFAPARTGRGAVGGHRSQWLIALDFQDRSKGDEGIEANGLGQIEEFDDVNPSIAAFYARDPGLPLPQCASKPTLAQAMSLSFGDQELDQPLMSFRADGFHSFSAYYRLELILKTSKLKR